MPAHTVVAKEPEPVSSATPQIVCPEIGDRLWYITGHAWLMPLIVSRVHSEHSVTGMAIDEQGWPVAVQRVYMKHLPSEHPEPPYCIWPERKLHT